MERIVRQRQFLHIIPDVTWKELVDKYVLPNGRITGEAPVLAADIIIAYNVQGVVNNGGFAYFFGADFPGMKHSQIAETFRRLRLEEHAVIIDQMVELFPDDLLQQTPEARFPFLEERFAWDRVDQRNLDVKKADIYFWDQSESVYTILDELADTL